MKAPPAGGMRGRLKLLLTLCGLSAGIGSAVVIERQLLEAGPVGWDLVHPDIPLLPQAVHQPAAMPGDGWPLELNGRLTAPDLSPGQITATARLPEDGRVTLLLPVGNGRELVALEVSRIAPASASVFVVREEGTELLRGAQRVRALECQGALPAPTEGDNRVGLALNHAGIRAWIGESAVSCRAPATGSGEKPENARIQAGLSRITLSEVGTSSPQSAPGPHWWTRLLAGVMGAGIFWTLGWAAGRRGISRGLFSILPTLAILPLSLGDLERAARAARIPLREPVVWALLGPLLLSVFLVGLFVLASRQSSESSPRSQLFALLLPCGLGLALLSVPLGPESPLAYLFLSFLGASVGLLVWANVHAGRLPAFNWISLFALLCGWASTEATLHVTATGKAWGSVSRRAPGELSVSEVQRGFEVLEHTREHPDYPLAYYPVAPGPRQAAHRIVALGGSSTGGAFVNDDLSTFYPALLDARLGAEVEVINQGVGGWTTLHIRRYLASRLDDLDPDVVVLYVAHNDIYTPSRRPYAEIFERYLKAEGISWKISRALQHSRVYLGMRFSLQALAGIEQAQAVPVEHARDNIGAIVEILSEHNATLLLVPEGVVMRTPDWYRYEQMLQSLAEEHSHVAYLDVTNSLTNPANGAVFVDNVHLTGRGHDLLATRLAEALEALDWHRAQQEPW